MRNKNFPEALSHVISGGSASRSNWPPDYVAIYLQNSTINLTEARHPILQKLIKNGGSLTINAHIDLILNDRSVLIGWTPTPIDLLANDWILIR